MAARSRRTQIIVRCVAGRSWTRCAGRMGTLTQNIGDQEHENATCYGGARRRDCFAGFRTDRHAQPRPGCRASLAVRPAGWPRKRLSRVRGRPIRFTTTTTISAPIPIRTCASTCAATSRAATSDCRGYIGGAFSGQSGLPVFRRECDQPKKATCKAPGNPGALFIATVRMPRSAVVIRGLDLIGARIRHLVSRTRCSASASEAVRR